MNTGLTSLFKARTWNISKKIYYEADDLGSGTVKQRGGSRVAGTASRQTGSVPTDRWTDRKSGTGACSWAAIKHLKDKLWEIRLKGRDGISRAMYVTATGKRVVVLRVFTKKTQKTPRKEIALALERAKEVNRWHENEHVIYTMRWCRVIQRMHVNTLH